MNNYKVREGWKGDKRYGPKDFIAVSYVDLERGEIGADFYFEDNKVIEIDPWREGNGVDEPEMIVDMRNMVNHLLIK